MDYVNHNRLKKLLIFIAIVIFVSLALTFGYMLFNDENQDESNLKHIPLSIDAKLDENEILKTDTFVISSFDTSFNEDINKWCVTFKIENVTNDSIDIEDTYHLVLYDEDNQIIDEFDDIFRSKIEPKGNSGIIIVINSNGSKIARISVTKA